MNSLFGLANETTQLASGSGVDSVSGFLTKILFVNSLFGLANETTQLARAQVWTL